MNREEAVLRELNLYPLWKLREQVTTIQAEAPKPTSIETKAEAAPDKSCAQAIGELEWPELKAMVRDCTACKLRAGCTQTVFGVGDEKAGWLFVGEGPGADEDAQGEPFVGQAGKLLDNMLMAIKLKRGKDVYIGNIVKCRPPGNRAPNRRMATGRPNDAASTSGSWPAPTSNQPCVCRSDGVGDARRGSSR